MIKKEEIKEIEEQIDEFNSYSWIGQIWQKVWYEVDPEKFDE